MQVEVGGSSEDVIISVETIVPASQLGPEEAKSFSNSHLAVVAGVVVAIQVTMGRRDPTREREVSIASLLSGIELFDSAIKDLLVKQEKDIE